MKAVSFKVPGYLEIIEKNLSPPKEGELLIKVDSCGVCGTDFHIYHGTSLARNNVILGHEFSGVITEKGKKSYDFQIGEKIAVDPNIYCGKCSYCREGKIQFCENHRALGVTQDGGFAEYALIPISQAYKIPPGFPLDYAAFAEPLSCCIRGIDRAEIKVGEEIVIIGGGTIGLMMLQLVKISGAAKVIIIEPVQNRRELAIKLGADFAFSPIEEYLFDSIMSITNGGADTVIECVGKPEAVEVSISITKRGGKVIIFGLAPVNSQIGLNLNEVFRKELSIRTSFLNPFTFRRSIELLVGGKISVDSFTVTKVDLDELKNLFMLGNNFNSLKYQFHNH